MNAAQKAQPIRTLTRGQAARAWPLVAGTLPVTAIAALLIVLAGRFGLHEDYREIAAYVVLMLSVAVNLGAMLLIHADAEKLAVAVPVRILRLPVATWRTTLGLMTFGLAAVALNATGATLIVKGLNGVTFTWWYVPCFAVCIMAALQTWSYSLRDTSPRAAVLSLLVIMTPLLLIMTRDRTYALLRSVHPAAVFVVAVPAMLLVGFLALMFNRRGGLAALLPEGVRRSQGGPFSAAELRPFRSKLATQLWYEWRQFGWMLPAFVLVAIALYFLGMPLAIALFGGTGINQDWSGDAPPASLAVDWLRNTQFVTSGVLFAAVGASVIAGALMFVKAGYWNRQSAYLMTLPVSTRTLARARLSMAFKSAVLATLLLAALLGASSLAMSISGEQQRLVAFLGQGYRDSNIASLTQMGDRIKDPFHKELGASPAEVMTFFVGVLFVTMWVALWALNAGWAFLTYGVVVGLPVAVLWLAQSFGAYDGGEGAESIANVAFWIASVSLLVLVFVLAVRSVWQRNVGWGAVAFAAAFAAVYVYAFLRFEAAYIEQPDANLIHGERFPHPINWALWMGLAALPIAPFFVHPWLLARTRSR